MTKHFLHLVRETENDKQTIGTLTEYRNYVLVKSFKSLELPWRNNQTDVSRVPPGCYPVIHRYSPKFKNHIILLNTGLRINVLIHSGNYYTNTKGCIILGSSLSDINGDGYFDVTNSRVSLASLLSTLPDPSTLLITENLK